ncbi:hypothetical protein Trydic_g15067 [Trypoxylus dichotomus]
MYGDEALKERQCRNWFDKFRFGNFPLKDEARAGRPNAADDDQINAISDSDHHIPAGEAAESLNVSHTAIENHLKHMGFIRKSDTWVPHELKKIRLT